MRLALSLPAYRYWILEHRIDIDPLLRKYCEDNSSPVRPELLEIERFTHLNTVKRLDASDSIQGRLLSFISHLCQPQLIVEIGTFTGYATGCLAEGLAPGGTIISIEHNMAYRELIETNLTKLGISENVTLHMGNALEYLPKIAGPIDLLFIDAAKYEYASYYDLAIEKIRPGGIILADNTLWKERVLQSKKDRMTQAMHNFNLKIAEDDRVEVAMIPYRDGVSFIRKK